MVETSRDLTVHLYLERQMGAVQPIHSADAILGAKSLLKLSLCFHANISATSQKSNEPFIA